MFVVYLDLEKYIFWRSSNFYLPILEILVILFLFPTPDSNIFKYLP